MLKAVPGIERPFFMGDLNFDWPLPKRLKPDETWETWIEAHRLPTWVHKDPYNLVRARLSTGTVVESRKK